MTQYVFTNGASTTLSHALSIDGTTVQLSAGTGSKFPSLGTDQVFTAVLIAPGVKEYVLCTAIAGDVCTVVRAQEGSAAGTFAVGALFEHRLTKAALNSMFQASAGGIIGGDLDMDGHNVLNAVFPGANYIERIFTGLIRGADVAESDADVLGAIGFPGAKGRPLLGLETGFSPIMTLADLAGIVFPWWGLPENLPAIWKLCDGTLGTPDLRRRFILGANVPNNGSNVAPFAAIGEFSGSFTAVSGGSGSHTHGGGLTGITNLQSGNIPPFVLNMRNQGFQFGGSNALIPNGGSGLYSGAAGHQHIIPVVDNHTHQTLTIPPYLSMLYVMLNL